MKVPAFVQAFISALVITLILFILDDLLVSLAGLEETGEIITYICYDILIAMACFYLSRKNPKSAWYIFIICNAAGILSAISEPNFWISNIWILICSGWLLSLITSILGARKGKRKVHALT
ncbi:MAG: hypothetical protein WAO52_13890 [Prolixibacteraceae bacterium]